MIYTSFDLNTFLTFSRESSSWRCRFEVIELFYYISERQSSYFFFINL